MVNYYSISHKIWKKKITERGNEHTENYESTKYHEYQENIKIKFIDFTRLLHVWYFPFYNILRIYRIWYINFCWYRPIWHFNHNMFAGMQRFCNVFWSFKYIQWASDANYIIYDMKMSLFTKQPYTVKCQSICLILHYICQKTTHYKSDLTQSRIDQLALGFFWLKLRILIIIF